MVNGKVCSLNLLVKPLCLLCEGVIPRVFQEGFGGDLHAPPAAHHESVKLCASKRRCLPYRFRYLDST